MHVCVPTCAHMYMCIIYIPQGPVQHLYMTDNKKGCNMNTRISYFLYLYLSNYSFAFFFFFAFAGNAQRVSF